VAAEPTFDPRRIIEILDRHHVEYVLVGGFAAQAHGARRQTLDIDVVALTTDENLERLSAALRDLGARLRVGGMTDDEGRRLPVTVDVTTLRNFLNSTWTTDAGQLDVLADIPSSTGPRTYDDLLGRSVPRQLHGILTRLAGLDDIVASKEHVARPKDREAPRRHLSVKGDGGASVRAGP